MHHKHVHRSPNPFFIFAFGLLLFWLFGFKLFFFLPLLFIFGAFGGWGACWANHHDDWDWNDEKPKRKGKPKRDSYTVIDDKDDVTYV